METLIEPYRCKMRIIDSRKRPLVAGLNSLRSGNIGAGNIVGSSIRYRPPLHHHNVCNVYREMEKSIGDWKRLSRSEVLPATFPSDCRIVQDI